MTQKRYPPLVVQIFLGVALCLSCFAQQSSVPQLSNRDNSAQPAEPTAAASFDQVVDRAVEREHFFMAQIRQLHPLVETYLQNLKEDKELNAPAPVSDQP